MEKFFGWVKQHPLLSAVFAIGTIILIYIVAKGGGSSGGSVSAGGLSEGAQVQLASIDAASQAHQLDASVALQQAQLQSNTAITQQATLVAAQLQAAQLQSATDAKKIDAEVALTTSQLQEQQNEAALNADVTKTQITTQAGILTSQINAARDEQLSTNQIFTHAIDTSAATQQLQIATAGYVAGKQLDYKSTIAADVLKNPEFGHNYGGSATGVTQILAALDGQGAEALASTNSAAYGGGAGSFLGELAGGITKGLFA